MPSQMANPDEPAVVMEYIGHNHKRPNLRRLIAREGENGETVELIEQMWNESENGWENLGLAGKIGVEFPGAVPRAYTLVVEAGEQSRVTEQ